MKKKIHLSLILCFLAIILISTNMISASEDDNTEKAGNEQTATDFYEYSITILSDDWFNYTVKEKILMLQIDDDTLRTMSDRQLVYAIADYPYLVNMYLSDSMEKGFNSLSETCSALKELMSRESGVESLNTYGNEIISLYKTTPRVDGQTEFVSNALKDLISYYNN